MSYTYYKQINDMRADIKNAITTCEESGQRITYKKLRIEVQEKYNVPEKHILKAIDDYDDYDLVTEMPEGSRRIPLSQVVAPVSADEVFPHE